MAPVCRGCGGDAPRSVPGGSERAFFRGDRHGYDAMCRQPPRRPAGGGAVSGDPWDGGAIGTADWTGVRLGDVLRAAGAAVGPDLHVAFESHDAVQGQPFGVSIPLAKALAEETLLAFAMNGAPLLPEHGFPARAVVPGFAGVRSPKWLRRITVQDHPSANPMQADDYKLFPPDVTAETADPARGHTIETMPLNAAICEPPRGARLAAGGDRRPWVRHRRRSGGRAGRCLGRRRPVLAPSHAGPRGRHALRLDVLGDRAGPSPGEHELAVRAWDAAGQTQPAQPDETWNFKGYLNTSWHRVRVEVA